MKIDHLITPIEAAQKLGISKSTITRCVQNGAPVHRWGATGHRYRIDVDEFVAWMECQGAKPAQKMAIQRRMSVEEMARARRESVRRKPRIEVVV